MNYVVDIDTIRPFTNTFYNALHSYGLDGYDQDIIGVFQRLIQTYDGKF